MPALIKTFADLVTSREATRAGFIDQALAKTDKAAPYVAQAKRLLVHLQSAAGPHDAAKIVAIRPDLLAAAGISDKAQRHMSADDLTAVIDTMVTNLAAMTQDWRDELLYRFLLIRGASLDGSMRNWVGAQAGKSLVAAIRAALDERKIVPKVTLSPTEKTQSIAWPNRLLVFDRYPCFVRNSVDAMLLDASGGLGEKEVLAAKARYLALGELKGGIDPAGADEHWKTAGSALDRLRTSYGEGCPPIFFVGAAIETAMAKELFAKLQNGTLTHAANLTVPEQLADLAAWLCAL